MVLGRWGRLTAVVVAAVVVCAASAAAADLSVRSQGTRIVTFRSDVPAAERARIVEAAGGKVLRELPFIDGAVISFGASLKSGIGLAALAQVESVEANEYRKWIESAVPAVMDFPAVKGVLGAARSAAAEAGPLAGEPVRTKEGSAPQPRSEVPWGVARVKAAYAWSRTTGKGVKVAVIDTGVDSSHPDLAANYAGGYNAIDPESSPMDGHGHGTHVAGSIAAVYNEAGVVGVAPGARIYGVKVLDEDGGGSYETIIAGIAWAAQNRMQVVNMSLGGPSSAALEKAVKRAAAAGVVIVAAAGNDPEAPVSAPASYREVIAVSASTSQDGLASFSTIGPEIAFIAPGHEIISTWPGSKYAKLSGTSMSSPHVAGLAALVTGLGARGVNQVREALSRAAAPLDGLTQDQQGYGMIEADRF